MSALDALPDWSAELTLLCTLLSPEPSDATALAGMLDDAAWGRFRELVIERHRVAPIVARRLDGLPIPDAHRSAITDIARYNGAEALNQITALSHLLRGLEAVGVTPVVLKGWPLAERLYGAAGNRHARDLDILVGPHEIAATADVIERNGFTPSPVYRLRGRLVGSEALREECYDLEYHHPTGLSVEMHWRTSHFAGWPDLTGRADLTLLQKTAIGPVQVLCDAADLVYLAGHGGMHVWARLKWLADIARLAARRGEAALSGDLALARDLDAWTVVALALRLSHRLLRSPLPDELRAPPDRLLRLETHILGIIASPACAPGTLRYRLYSNTAAFRMADQPGQSVGIVRYAIWRRLRLGLAGLHFQRPAIAAAEAAG